MLNSQFGAQVLPRLQQEDVIWFTTVSPRGIPTPNPVWFYWDGEVILVYSQPASFRIRNIKLNPNVALALQGVDGLGNNVVIINGLAQLNPGPHTIHPGYWEKYAKFLPDLDMTVDGITRDYSVEIRVKPLKVRTG